MTKLIVIVFTAALLACAFVNAEEPKSAIVTIPANKFFMFDAEINGKPIKIFLDTGGAISKVWKETAKRIGIPQNGGKFDVKIGDVVVKNEPIVIDTHDNGYTQYGMEAFFGNQFAKRLFMICDYPSSRALFVSAEGGINYSEANTVAEKKLGAVEEDVVVPFIVSKSGHILVEGELNGKEKIHLVVDTGGAEGNVFTAPTYAKLGITYKQGTTSAIDKMTIAGHDFGKTTFKHFKINGLEQSIASFAKEGLTLGGLLGTDFLKKYRVGFDYAEKKLHIGTFKESAKGSQLPSADEDALALEGCQPIFDESIELLKEKKFDECVKGFSRIFKKFPKENIGYSSAYNLACAYALSGDKKLALDWLEKALDSGLKDFDHIKKDPDLAVLREEARYKELMLREPL